MPSPVPFAPPGPTVPQPMGSQPMPMPMPPMNPMGNMPPDMGMIPQPIMASGGLQAPNGVPQGMPPFAPAPLPPPQAQQPPVVIVDDRPKRKRTKVIRDPETNLIIGAETVEEPLP